MVQRYQFVEILDAEPICFAHILPLTDLFKENPLIRSLLVQVAGHDFKRHTYSRRNRKRNHFS